MARNLDLTALRSFAAVADAGGVTRAAAQLNLTQSAVSMQLKRLEESLGLPLLDRSARTIALTAQGEQLLGYARRLLALNDEAWGRLTHPAFEGEIDFGVPHDIIYPHVPGVLQRFAAEYPAGQAAAALALHQRAQGAVRPRRDGPDPDHRGRASTPAARCWPASRWSGSARRAARPGGSGRCASPPARTASSSGRRIDALEAAGIPWELAVEFDLAAAVDASVAADLAVSVQMQSGGAGALRGDPPRRRAAGAARAPRQHVRDRRAAGGARRAARRCCCARPTASRSASRPSRRSADPHHHLAGGRAVAQQVEPGVGRLERQHVADMRLQPALRVPGEERARSSRATASGAARHRRPSRSRSPSGSSPAGCWPGSAAPSPLAKPIGSSRAAGPGGARARRRSAAPPTGS